MSAGQGGLPTRKQLREHTSQGMPGSLLEGFLGVSAGGTGTPEQSRMEASPSGRSSRAVSISEMLPSEDDSFVLGPQKT